MSQFIYHSPEGDRQLVSKGKNEDGTVNLHNEDGELEIGNCQIEPREGGCSPAPVEDDAPKTKSKK